MGPGRASARRGQLEGRRGGQLQPARLLERRQLLRLSQGRTVTNREVYISVGRGDLRGTTTRGDPALLPSLASAPCPACARSCSTLAPELRKPSRAKECTGRSAREEEAYGQSGARRRSARGAESSAARAQLVRGDVGAKAGRTTSCSLLGVQNESSALSRKCGALASRRGRRSLPSCGRESESQLRRDDDDDNARRGTQRRTSALDDGR